MKPAKSFTNFSSRNKAQTQTLTSKSILSQNNLPQKHKAINNSRYQFSPDKQVDTNKNAWERLLARSFDPKTAQFIRNYKENVICSKGSSSIQKAQTAMQSPKKPSQNNSKPQLSTQMKQIILQQKPHEYTLTGAQTTQANSNNTSVFIIGSPRSTKQSEPVFQQKQSLQSLPQSRRTTNAWNQLMDKTSDCKIAKNISNYCSRRTTESFLSGRTINPAQYSSQANLLLSSSKKALMSQSPSKRENEDITGCRKKQSPKVHNHNFKLAYPQKELQKEQEQRLVINIERSKSRGCIQEGFIPNENAASYLGSSNIGCMLQDKTNNQQAPALSTRIKHQQDYNSNISCLSPQLSARRHPQKMFECRKGGKKIDTLKHIITSLDPKAQRNSNGKGRVDDLDTLKQVSARKKQTYYQTFASSMQASRDNSRVERPNSARRIPDGIKNAFQSQIQNFS